LLTRIDWVISLAGQPERQPNLKKPTALRGAVGVWDCENSDRTFRNFPQTTALTPNPPKIHYPDHREIFTDLAPSIEMSRRYMIFRDVRPDQLITTHPRTRIRSNLPSDTYQRATSLVLVAAEIQIRSWLECHLLLSNISQERYCGLTVVSPVCSCCQVLVTSDTFFYVAGALLHVLAAYSDSAPGAQQSGRQRLLQSWTQMLASLLRIFSRSTIACTLSPEDQELYTKANLALIDAGHSQSVQ